MKLKTAIERVKLAMDKNYRVILVYAFLISMSVFNVTMVYLWTRHAKGFKHPHFKNDISCFDDTDTNALPYIDEELIRNTNNIFFVETSCRGYLDSIQACAVESAAREQFDGIIHVVFAGPVDNKTYSTGIMEELQKMNVQLVRIEIKEAFKNTPLERIIKENQLSNSLTKVAHASDILRIFLLWKYSGIYMDLDVVTLKSFAYLKRDFIGIGDSKRDNFVSTGVIGLSKSPVGREIASLLVEELGNSYNSRLRSWSGSGVSIFTQLLWRICNTTVQFMNSENCQGFEVYNSKVFYPLALKDYKKYAENEDIDLKGSYAIHLWNRLISIRQTIAPKNSLFDRIAKRYCPTVYKMFNDSLGV